jgi:C4-type Zn-finger protein
MNADEFRKLVQARGGVPLACPVCGADAWGGLEDILDLPVRGGVLGAEAIAPTCGQCGYMLLFDLQFLLGGR